MVWVCGTISDSVGILELFISSYMRETELSFVISFGFRLNFTEDLFFIHWWELAVSHLTP